MVIGYCRLLHKLHILSDENVESKLNWEFLKLRRGDCLDHFFREELQLQKYTVLLWLYSGVKEWCVLTHKQSLAEYKQQAKMEKQMNNSETITLKHCYNFKEKQVIQKMNCFKRINYYYGNKFEVNRLVLQSKVPVKTVTESDAWWKPIAQCWQCVRIQPYMILHHKWCST